MTPDPHPHDGGLDAAKKKLSEITGRPFDVDKVLAESGVRREHEKESRKRAEEKLERALAAARLHGTQKRIRELEAEKLRSGKDMMGKFEVVRHALDEEKARLRIEMQHSIKKTEKGDI